MNRENKLKYARLYNDIEPQHLAQILGLNNENEYLLKEQNKTDFLLSEAKILSELYNTTIESLFFDLEEINFFPEILNLDTFSESNKRSNIDICLGRV